MEPNPILETLLHTSVQSIVASIISLVIVTGVGGYLVGKYKEKLKKKKANEERARQEQELREQQEKARLIIEKATARRLIFQAHTQYCIDGDPLTIDRFREITETFEAYTILGGNGTAKKYYDEISQIVPVLVN